MVLWIYFSKAEGVPVGNSRVEEDRLEEAKRCFPMRGRVEMLIPVDSVCGNKFSEDSEAVVYDEVPDGWMGLDIG